MPLLILKTNIDLEKTTTLALMNHATRVVAEALGKPESYVMVNVCPNEHMAMGMTTLPTVYMELKSVNLSDNEIPQLSKVLTEMAEDRLKVTPARVYIEFSSVPSSHWGYNGGTF